MTFDEAVTIHNEPCPRSGAEYPHYQTGTKLITGPPDILPLESPYCRNTFLLQRLTLH